MADLVLDERQAELVARLLDTVLRHHWNRDHAPAGPITASLAAALATAVPDAAAKLAALRIAAASASYGRSEAMRGSKLAVAAPGSRSSSQPELTAGQAAAVTGLSARAIRLACTEGRLDGRKSPAGSWVIRQADLAAWMRRRAA